MVIKVKDIYEHDKKIKSLFFGDDTFKSKELFIDNTLVGILYYINGISDEKKIGELIIKPVLELEKMEFYNPSVSKVSFEKGVSDLLNGDCLVILRDKILSIDTKANFNRGFQEPDNETVEKGPKMGFVENLLTNVSLIRKNLKTNKLKIAYVNVGGENNNTIALLYLDDRVDKLALKELKKRLSKIIPVEALDSNKLVEKLKDNKYSPFMTIGSTGRPDVCSQKMLEGRIILLLDGSPQALSVPYLFVENFRNPDDYYVNFYYGSFNRVLRILCFLVSIMTPGIYISFILYHQELIPTKLAESIIASRRGVPFPSFVEVIFLLLAFDIIRETGSMIPKALGTALSIVSGLILGQAAVEARIVSTVVIIVVSLTSLTGLVTPSLKTPIIFWRIIFFFLSLLMGFQGFLTAGLLLIIFLSKMKSFNRYYLSHFFDFGLKHFKDTYIRFSFRRVKK